MATENETKPADTTTVLVANRGEIALRIMRTLRRLGMRSVAIHSDADAEAPHTRAADSAVRVGSADLADSYLNGAAIVDAALATGATMVHPGYGFLAENVDFARACSDAGLVFVGPPPEAIEAMGDKIRAKTTVAEVGVPLLPGFTEKTGHPLDDGELTRAADHVGYPLLLKPSAGGGGKGMRLVRDPTELPTAAEASRREARAAFGDATLLAERFVDQPRHIEVQVLGDEHGNIVHLGERECSLQRRHQKIVEEAPSPLLTADQRAAMGEAAVAAAKACDYVGAGTVEFVVRPPAEGGTGPTPTTLDYAFLEMNTRLQVEHPVTEATVTVAGQHGLDLVELQLRVAQGQPLPFSQADVAMAGHAVEARVYAEDPAHDFLPTGGRVLLLREPHEENVRVDSGVTTGTEITPLYDPLLAKVVTWGHDRAAALHRMDTALADYTLLGCRTNIDYLRRLLQYPRVVAGDLSTDLTERAHRDLSASGDEVTHAVYAAAALDRQLGLEPSGMVTDRFDVPDNWRIGERAWTTWRLRAPRHGTVAVTVRRFDGPCSTPSTPDMIGYEVRVGDSEVMTARATHSNDGWELTVTLGGRTAHYVRAESNGDLWLGHQGHTWELREEPAFVPIRARETSVGSTVRSPMPGTVLAVLVEDGHHVPAGTPVAVVEAMKMEHTVTTPVGGVVRLREAHPGYPVAMDAVLATIEADLSEASPARTDPVTHEE